MFMKNYLMATEAYRDNRSEQEMYKKKELLKDHVEAQTMSDSTMRWETASMTF